MLLTRVIIQCILGYLITCTYKLIISVSQLLSVWNIFLCIYDHSNIYILNLWWREWPSSTQLRMMGQHTQNTLINIFLLMISHSSTSSSVEAPVYKHIHFIAANVSSSRTLFEIIIEALYPDDINSHLNLTFNLHKLYTAKIELLK